MELKTPTTIITTTVATPATTTTPETETETTPTKQKALSFTNGAFKLLYPPPPQTAIVYRECLKNHAAALGGHALDGCGEFMPSPTAIATDPTSLKCAACGCHRNFHRRDPEETLTHMIEYHPHLPAPITPHRVRSPNSSVSPPPISSSYYPSAPQMLLALSTGGLSVKPENHQNTNTVISPISGSGRKRFRTKFSQEQKDKMYSFSEKLGWKMQKRDEVLVEEFCNEVGVGKSVLKVWMHNNKHTFAKRDLNGNVNGNSNGNGNNGGSVTGGLSANYLQHNSNNNSNTVMPNPNNSTTTNTNNNINNISNSNSSSMMNHLNHGNNVHVGTNCSSSSS